MPELDNFPISPSCSQFSLLNNLSKHQLIQEVMYLQKAKQYDVMTIGTLHSQIRSLKHQLNQERVVFAQDLESANERIAELQGGQNAAI